MLQTDAITARWASDPALVGSLAVAVLGALAYALIAFGVGPFGNEAFGTDIYDLYYLAILEGRLDLPARVLRFEGHYAPDGKGYLYHGVAPLLTRFAFGWTVALPQASLAQVSVWLWAVLGTACYHLAFLTAADRAWAGDRGRRTFWAVILACAVWFAAPGILIAARPSLYHEPVAVAYAMAALFILLWVRAAAFHRPWRWVLVGLALCAAIALHARPNVAVGLYLGLVLAVGQAMLSDRRRALIPAALALALAGLSGAGFLAMNSARFGAPTEVDGQFDASRVQYGTVYWGQEEPDSPRATASKEHGRFNLRRVLPNLAFYSLDPPDYMQWSGLPDLVLAAYRRATLEDLGYIRIEPPRGGMLWLWAGWIFLAAACPWRAPKPLLGLLLATGVTAVLTLAYGTITLRYRFDIWPALAVLAIFGLPTVTAWLARSRKGIGPPAVLGLAVYAGLMSTLQTTSLYTRQFSTEGNEFFAHWSYGDCVEKGRTRGRPEALLAEICTLPGDRRSDD
ncbi:MAG: hypothetical protein QNJ67_22640 [Kiloniellales bacterium]|nr:hypothetical protein [Kiloniellales bacterium]